MLGGVTKDIWVIILSQIFLRDHAKVLITSSVLHNVYCHFFSNVIFTYAVLPDNITMVFPSNVNQIYIN